VSTLQISKLSEVYVGIGDTAVAVRDEVIDEAKLVLRVDSDATREMAAEILRKLKRIERETEDSRVDIGRPVLDLTKKINEIAKSHVAPAKAERERIQKLVDADAWQQEQARRAKEQAARDEQIRLERERQLAIDAARKAETQQQREEALRHAAAVKEVQQALPVKVEPKAAPVGISKEFKFFYEILDPAKAYAARPDFFELSPKARVIDATINLPGANHEIPGMRIFEGVKTGVRA
jgi:hypothetical protein